jgi:hypothetical protein
MQDVKKCRRPKVTATCQAPLGRQGARSLAPIEHGHLLRGSDDAKQSATTSCQAAQRTLQKRPAGTTVSTHHPSPHSTRLQRLRAGKGTDIFAGTIERLESGKPGDKRLLSAMATALGAPFCRLVCGDHSCTDRPCATLLR